MAKTKYIPMIILLVVGLWIGAIISKNCRVCMRCQKSTVNEPINKRLVVVQVGNTKAGSRAIHNYHKTVNAFNKKGM